MLLVAFLCIAFKMSLQSEVSHSNWEKFIDVQKYIDAISVEMHRNLSSKCYEDVQKYVNGVKEKQPWSLRVFAANGPLKDDVGLMRTLDECTSISEIIDNSTIIGKYCSAKLTANDGNGTGGICFPGSCSAKEIELIHRGIDIPIYLNASECHVQERNPFHAATVCAIIIFGIILCLVLTSTTYELIMRCNKKSAHTLFKSFSLVTNGNNLLALTTPANAHQISCLWGIRVFAITCIIFKHVVYVKENVTDEPYLSEWKSTLARKIVDGSTFSVDTFLLIAGLLVSFNPKRSLKNGDEFSITKYYLNRYLRLTPTLAFMILVHVALTSYLGFEQLLVKQYIDPSACRRYWWSALLYVQNFVNADRMCLVESWYLSVDMQIFLVSPIFLIPFRKKPKIALSVMVVLILISSAYCFSTVWLLDMTPSMNYNIYYNIKPYTRVTPWFLGFIMGYFLSIPQEARLKIGKGANILLTLASIAAVLFCVYALPWYSEDKILYGSRLALIRPLWSIAICWIIYSCVSGYNGALGSSSSSSEEDGAGTIGMEIPILRRCRVPTGFAQSKNGSKPSKKKKQVMVDKSPQLEDIAVPGTSGLQKPSKSNESWYCHLCRTDRKIDVQQYIGSIESAISIDGNLNLSSNCYEEVENYVYGVKENQQWALRMYRANGEIQSGLLKEPLGSFEECVSVGEALDNITLIGKYCLWHSIDNVENGTKSAFFSGAICFPGNCSAGEIRQIYHAIGIPIYLTSSGCYLQEPKSYDAITICVIVVLGVVLCLVLTSTAYELVTRRNGKSAHILLKSFSLVSNGTSLLKVIDPTSTNQISCLWGLRVITIVLVIFNHVVFVKKIITTDELYLNEWKSTVASKIINGARLSVDTFFVITGILVSFNPNRSSKKVEKFNVVKYYLNRYFRLTPTLAFIVLVDVALAPHLGFGQLVVKQNLDSMSCRRYWWSALLYIQNFVNIEEMCVAVSWYLCVDMQIFLASPLFLIPFRKKPKVVLSVIGALLLMSSVFSFLTVWLFDMTPHMNYLIIYYTKPYTRITPWFVGFITGYILSASKNARLNVGNVTNVILTLASIATIIFLTCEEPLRTNNNILYACQLALVRPLWSVAVCWIIYSCATGYNKFINRLLSLNVFQILSKLTYAAYLVHLTLITLCYTMFQTATVLTHINMPRRSITVDESIHNLVEYFNKEKQNNGPLTPLTAVHARVSDALKIDTKTMSNALRRHQNQEENKETEPRQKSLKTKNMDQQQKSEIRNTIYNMYINHEHVTLDTLLTKMKERALIIVALDAATSFSVIPRSGTKIVGGENALINDFPHQVSLQFGGRHICGGSIVSSDAILTAAHCVVEGSSVSYSVRYGTSYQNSMGTVVAVSTLKSHPYYNDYTSDSDIAIVKLRRTIIFSSVAQGISITAAPHTNYDEAVVTGWGALTEGGSSPFKLQAVKLKLIPHIVCSTYYYGAISGRMICYGYQFGGKDSCQGDSGGPLISGGVQIGVVSWGNGCARPNFPGVYTDVYKLRDFVLSNF
ncbi:hypothetical protein FQA39_LY17726 [Lamprigera yunnana]|nr:hypothetical protein FQA39_LY17726 [Lamprigera yunnana]